MTKKIKVKNKLKSYPFTMVINITGAQGAGKSTVRNLIYAALKLNKYPVGFYSSEPHTVYCSLPTPK